MLQSDGIEPEFGCMVRTLDMNMGWLLAITCMDERFVDSHAKGAPFGGSYQGWLWKCIRRTPALSCLGPIVIAPFS
jgi:hypothetical protein